MYQHPLHLKSGRRFQQLNSELFIQNKYNKWYFNIIEKAQLQNQNKSKEIYYERHHIIPKSLGGSNKKENLVLLTAKEHYICHALLCKMVNGINKNKMIFAFNRMQSINKNQQRYTSKLYEYFKIYHSNLLLKNTIWVDRKHSEETKEKMKKAALKRWKNNDELKKKMSISQKGRKLSDETKEKLSISLKGKISRKGFSLTEEHKEKLRKPKTQEHKEKLRQAALKQFEDPKQREMKSNRMKGNIPWNKKIK